MMWAGTKASLLLVNLIAMSSIVFCDKNGAVSIELSDAASELLLETSRDPNGTILRLSAMGGAYLRTNGRMLGGPAREQERWESAIQQLVRLGLIEAQGDKVLCITHEGYETADALRCRG
jgi:hypothetical protein